LYTLDKKKKENMLVANPFVLRILHTLVARHAGKRSVAHARYPMGLAH
jgi:hypothetical protein